MEGAKTFEEKRAAFEHEVDALTKEYKEVCKDEVKKRIEECNEGVLDLSHIAAEQYDGMYWVLQEVFNNESLREKLSQNYF